MFLFDVFLFVRCYWFVQPNSIEMIIFSACVYVCDRFT